MNERCKEILRVLLNSENYITLPQLEEIFHISRRSIYYDLCRINEWLEDNNIKEIEVVRKKGIFIEEEVRQQIEQCSGSSLRKEVYILSPMERVRVIICIIIYSRKKIYIEELMNECMVSRNTVFNDLQVVVNQLQEYNLKLEYESKKGYQIAGDAVSKRAVFLMNLHELEVALQSGALHFLEQEQINVYFEKLKEIEGELKTKYVDGTLRSLASLMPVMEQGDESLYFPNLKKEELENTREYELVQEYFPDFDEKEQIYLCLHLLGARVAIVSDDIFESEPNQTVYELTKALVAEFERVACVIFENREDLERALFVHINSSLYRYRFGIQTADIMSKDIIREYPDLFEITKIVSNYIEKQIGLPIPDGEIAYLALHFGSHLSVARNEDSALRILVVCANGVSTGNMIKRELQKLLPEAEIVGVLASDAVKNAQNICDVIVTTVSLKSVIPVICVHPILTDLEREKILNHPKIREKYSRYTPDKIFEIVKPYIEEKYHNKVKEDLMYYLKESVSDSENAVSHHKNLLDILNLSHIAIHNENMSWMQAIKEAGKSLKEADYIEERYLEQIISQIRYYGPYMFITPGVVLAHAKPEDGVNRLSVSFHIFKQDIVFSQMHAANIILVLATKDQESHLRILKDIVEIFSMQPRIDELLKMQTPEEIMEFLQRILN